VLESTKNTWVVGDMTAPYDEASVQKCLRYAVESCTIRSLSFAAGWASEQLCGMNYPDDDDADTWSSSKMDENKDRNMFSYEDSVAERAVSRQVKDAIIFSTTLLRNGEFHRCANLLRKSRLSSSNNPGNSSLMMNASALALFLASYALYMAGEKVKDQTIADTKVSNDAATSKTANPKAASRKGADEETHHQGNASVNTNRNPYLNDIFRDLYPLFVAHVREKSQTRSSPEAADSNASPAVRMDGFLMFMFAVVVKGIRLQGGGPNELFANPYGRKLMAGDNAIVEVPSAVDLLLESIRLFPWNW
jgi:hypothetical protein